MQELLTQWTARTRLIAREHASAFALAIIAAIITLAPNYMLWHEQGYRGIEMMTLDAENHYMARIHEAYEGDWAMRDTFLADKNLPYATSPLGEDIIAVFGKAFGLSAARAAIVSKPISVFVITLLIYICAYLLSRSRISALIAAAFAVLGYTLIDFSPTPFLDLLHGAPTGGPFLQFSRLVNLSVSGIFLFGGLALMFRTLFERAETRWWQTGSIGAIAGLSVYVSPFVYTFLGALLLLSFIWFLVRRDYARARAALIAGVTALVITIPFVLNYSALHALPAYEYFARFVGAVPKRAFVLGMLLPLIAALVAIFWPRAYPREGKTFLLLSCAALFLSLNQQLITGTYLQPGHYHWYITKPLAGIVAGLFIGYLIERFIRAPFWRGFALAFVLGILVYNSMGMLAPWYQETRAATLATQSYGSLVDYLNTIKTPQTIWTDETTSDFIPIYTAHNIPNNINIGAYPIGSAFMENRLFLEYRLRGVQPKDFEETIRAEAHHVADRLWGLWLRELTGNPAAVPEEEFTRLSAGYADFYKKTWPQALDTLGVTLIVARSADRAPYDAIPALHQKAEVGDFVIYERL